jgi:glycosyltransferase involved in cell wall biosynthesis
VGFDVGGVSTWLKDGLTGFLILVKAAEKLLEKVKLLIHNPDLYRTISERSREVALEEFTPDKHIYILKNIYEKSIIKIR